MENFSDRLNRLMKEKKISQTKLSQLLDIRQSTVSSWCREISMPDVPTQIKIAEIFEVKPEYLTYGVEKSELETTFIGLEDTKENFGITKDELIEFYKWKADKAVKEKDELLKSNQRLKHTKVGANQ
jgi:transcriptional regulator with XRE-family HTH domain